MVGAYIFTTIISVISIVVLLPSGIVVAKSSIELHYPIFIVVIGNAILVLVLCALGGKIGNIFGRRFVK